MKPFHHYLILVSLTFSTLSCSQENPQTISQNTVQPALDAFNNKDYQKAFELVDNQLEDDSNNLDARYLRAILSRRAENYSFALCDVNYAIENYKGTPQVYRSTLYDLKADILSDIDFDAEAADNYLKAARLAKTDNPDNVLGYYFDYAQHLYFAGRLRASEKAFRKLLRKHTGYPPALVSLARIYADQEKYDEAVRELEMAESYDSQYSLIYRWKMQVFYSMGRKMDAVDAAVKYAELNDDPNISLILDCINDSYAYAEKKLVAALNSEDASDNLFIVLSKLYSNHREYRKEIEIYNRVEKKYGANAFLHRYRAICYMELGEYSKALMDINLAMEMEPDELVFICTRGDVYRMARIYDKAIADYTRAIEIDPTSSYPYSARGDCYEQSNDDAKALEDYSTWIELDANGTPYMFICRGRIYEKQGHSDLARADYERVLQIDTIPKKGSCRHFALIGLGELEQAILWMNELVKSNPEEAGTWYNRACTFSRMGRTADALESLETALQNGYRNFSHMEEDKDMDSLRDLPEYKELIMKYK